MQPARRATKKGPREGVPVSAEHARLAEDAARTANWKRWGPYLSERQWGTVREDYSEDGNAWAYFPHEHARSRAYRWGEDGLLGICNRRCHLCFALALWNGKDPILKERLFGLSNPEGNHGEDVKEAYFHLDATPTASYLKALYRYPHERFPYERLVAENARRGRDDPEFEIEDTGVFNDGRFFDVWVEYAKAAAEDILIRVSVWNRGPETARLHVLPTLWFRNTWSWGAKHEGLSERPRIALREAGVLAARHPELGEYVLACDAGPDGEAPETLFTENETNAPKLFGAPAASPWFKDAFHEAVVLGRAGAVRPDRRGSKAAAWYVLDVPAHGGAELHLRLVEARVAPKSFFGAAFDATFTTRRREADLFHAAVVPRAATSEERNVARQAFAGLVWSKQFYHYIVADWLEGDPRQPPPPPERLEGRNRDWPHLFNFEVLSVPDKWEYPWYAAWDLAFHTLPFARIDPHFAKDQLALLLREWYMHPNGQLPAYEWALSDVNPPVHAWAVWRVYKMSAPRGARDTAFLESAFLKLLLNFTWWVNRKDVDGNHLFSGGFLGLDNIGIFDRSKPLPLGGHLEQADGTAWMAFFASTMLAISLELAKTNRVYEDIASKFFEHFVAIADAMNNLGGTGLWDERDGFYYDRMHANGESVPLRARSMVGLIPLLAGEVLETEEIARLPGFAKRTRWFLENRGDLADQISHMAMSQDGRRRLLAIPTRERLARVLSRMLDESEFLSPFGVRSLSRRHLDEPFLVHVDGHDFRLAYEPAEGRSGLFGGNSNWRGPVWFPLNWLLIEALERYHHFYGDSLSVECPTGSGRFANLGEVAVELNRRLASLFLRDASGVPPSLAAQGVFAKDPHLEGVVLFHEYFDGDTGRGCGASHQTGWTALSALCLESLGQARERKPS